MYGEICRGCAYKKNLELRKPKKIKKIRTKKDKNNEYIKRYKKTKEWLIDLKGNKCALCGKVFPWYAYDFHHKNGNEKESKISRYTRLTKKHLQNLPEFWEEFNKCILICAICHRKLHLKGDD